MMAACYKSGNDKSNNNEDKVYLLLRGWDLVCHMLDYMLDQMLDHIIIDFITTVLQTSPPIVSALPIAKLTIKPTRPTTKQKWGQPANNANKQAKN